MDGPFKTLSDPQKETIRAGYRKRIEAAGSPAWRDLWFAELSVLEGDLKAAQSRLLELVGSSDRAIAVHACTMLGHIFESLGDTSAAAREFTNALQLSVDEADNVRCRLNLARLANMTGDHDATIRLLDDVDTRTIEPDAAQFLAHELGTALMAKGRIRDAGMLFDRLTEHFPDRSEIPMIRSQVVGTRN